MGNTLLADLIAAGNVPGWLDYRGGSALERITRVAPTMVGGTNAAILRAAGRFGVKGTGGGAAALDYGNNANWNLSAAGTVLAIQTPLRLPMAGAQWQIVYSKGNWGGGTLGHWLYYDWNGSNPVVIAQIGDAGGHQSIFNTAALSVGQPNLYAFGWNGAIVSGWLNGVPLAPTAQTRVPDASASTLNVAGLAGSYSLTSGPLHSLVFVNRLLTGAEVARYWDEFLAEGISPDCCRRGFVYIDKGREDWWYASQGIVLDTDFSSIMVGATRKIADKSPSNYQGTIVGTPTPASGGTGQSFNAYTDDVSFGDVTQLNSAASFSIESIFDLPAAAIGSTWFCVKKTDNNNRIAIGAAGGGSATAKQIYAYVANGSGTYGVTNAPGYLRAGTKQHVLVVYNGNGATDADRLKIWLDGELTTLTLVGPIPATTANMVGAALRNGTGVETMLGTYNSRKVYTGALTPAQARAAYLTNFAQRLTLRETFEDVPVSLVASVGAGGYIGQWRVVSGTWKCSETSDGKRWLECVTAGQAAFPVPADINFGTLTFYWQKVNDPGELEFLFGASLPASYSVAGQTGYMVGFSTQEHVGLWRINPAPSLTQLFLTAPAYIALNTTYQMTVARRPSDGSTTVYIKGGAFTSQTKIVVAAGSNPAADVTYTTGPWVVVNAAAGDKVLLWDPAPHSSAGLFHWQGVLSPVAGELYYP